MTGTYEGDEESRRPEIDAARLWAGGLATAVVAALVSVVGVLVARGLLGVDIIAPQGSGAWGAVSTGWYAFGAAVLALAATGLMHVLVLFTPRPMRFFGWVACLATIVAVLAPFVAGGGAGSRIATAALNLVLGVAIGSLVAGSARTAMRTAYLRALRGGNR